MQRFSRLIRMENFWFFLVLIILGHSIGEEFDGAALKAELELDDLELEDICSDLSRAESIAIEERNFEEKKVVEQSLGQQFRIQAEHLKQFPTESVSVDFQRNFSILIKPGDGLLPEEEWNKLVSFHNELEELKAVSKIDCYESEPCKLDEIGYKNFLSTSRDLENLNRTWSSWQSKFESKKDQFRPILNLVKQSATLNDHAGVENYWEMLTDLESSITKAELFWEEIKPLYEKLHSFVKLRLESYYDYNETDSEIPVYLLGENFGRDWSNIAEKILPHPQIHFDVSQYLRQKKVVDIYKLAEDCVSKMGLGDFGEQFWHYSQFNQSCEPKLLSYCSEEYTQVFDCDDKLNWEKFLNVHEIAAKVKVRNVELESLIRRELRGSGVDSAFENLVPIIAIENLPNNNILNKNVFKSEDDNDPDKMTKLLLIALRVLPQLPYYLAADKWRLQELDRPNDNVAKTWWEFRKDYQKVKGVKNEEFDFLGDSYITANKPYLSKFFGPIIAFQILSYYKGTMDDPFGNVAEEIGKDRNFLDMLRERATMDWPYLLVLHFGFELSTEPLLDFFKPLEDYLENAPLEQAPIVTTTPEPTTTTEIPQINFKSGKMFAQPESDKENITEITTEFLLNDDPEGNLTKSDVSREGLSPSESTTMYVGLGLLIIVAIVLLIGLLHKKLTKRRTVRNRRFES